MVDNGVLMCFWDEFDGWVGGVWGACVVLRNGVSVRKGDEWDMVLRIW